MNVLILFVLATAGYQGKDLDFAALPQFSPSKEWVAKAIEATGRKATEIEIEESARLFDATIGDPTRRRFPPAALVAADPRWQAECDAIAQEIHGRKATVPELYWFQRFGFNQTDARARLQSVRRWAGREHGAPPRHSSDWKLWPARCPSDVPHGTEGAA